MEEEHANVPDSGEQNSPSTQPAITPIRLPEIGDLAHPFSHLEKTTYITYGLVVIIGLIFLVQMGEQSTGPYLFDVEWRSCYDGTRISHDWAACGAAMVYGQQFYRMLTSMFLHGSTTHIAFNAIALYSLGLDMERIYGRGRYLFIYFMGGLFGSLLSFIFRGPSEFSVGASGAIFAIAGMNLAFFYMYRNKLGDMGEQRFQSMLRMVGINLVIGFVLIRINNYAHIGGLIGGAVLGYLFLPWYTVTQVKPSLESRDQNSLAAKPGLAVAVVLVFLALTLATWTMWRYVSPPLA